MPKIDRTSSLTSTPRAQAVSPATTPTGTQAVVARGGPVTEYAGQAVAQKELVPRGKQVTTSADPSALWGEAPKSAIPSQDEFAALPTESVYCMTKAGISHLTKCLAVEWGKYNITVNAIAPTFIYTPGTEPALSDPKFKAEVIERIAALHRIGQPVEVTGAVVFLASPAASLITGDTIMIDGGWTAR